jgi:predicted nuclease of predicted toxin-antitoxin system
LSNHLRLLLDEAITQPLADEIRKSPSVNAEYIRDLPIKGAPDSKVMEYAKSESRIVVTTEGNMNHKSFPVCTHPGIIVLCGAKKHESFQAGMFQRFLLSGHRRYAKDAVSFLSEKQIRIKAHDGETIVSL